MTFTEMLCETDFKQLVGNRPGLPVYYLRTTIRRFGLRCVEKRLPSGRLGLLNLQRGELQIDPWKQDPLERNLTIACLLGYWRLFRCQLEDGKKLDERQEVMGETYGTVFLLPRALLVEEWGFKELLWCQQREIIAPLNLVRVAVDSLSAKFRLPRWAASERLLSALGDCAEKCEAI